MTADIASPETVTGDNRACHTQSGPRLMLRAMSDADEMALLAALVREWDPHARIVRVAHAGPARRRLPAARGAIRRPAMPRSAFPTVPGALRQSLITRIHQCEPRYSSPVEFAFRHSSGARCCFR